MAGSGPDDGAGPTLTVRLGRAGMLLHRRWLLLTRRRADPVIPRRAFAPGEAGAVLVLQDGANASVDYFLRPRLEAAGQDRPWAIVDLGTAPEAAPLLGRDDLLVIVCRYISPRWLRALEREIDRLKGVVLFVDDDLPAMVRDRSIPAAARGRILRDHVRHGDRLGALTSALWVTSPVLAEAVAAPAVRILEPLPTERPRDVDRSAPPLVVYHGGPAHRREQAFVLEVAAALAARRPDIRFEITGDAGLERRAAGLDTVDVLPTVPWPAYRRAQAEKQASIMLAPLFDTAVNRARAPVKVFDAARLGAAGLYADHPVYARHVRDGTDGRLLPMDVGAWVGAIEALIAAPDERYALAKAAHDRINATFDTIPPLSLQDVAP